jgi:hypothetical protein
MDAIREECGKRMSFKDMQCPEGKGEEERTVYLKRNGWKIIQNKCNKTLNFSLNFKLRSNTNN